MSKQKEILDSAMRKVSETVAHLHVMDDLAAARRAWSLWLRIWRQSAALDGTEDRLIEVYEAAGSEAEAAALGSNLTEWQGVTKAYADAEAAKKSIAACEESVKAIGARLKAEEERYAGMISRLNSEYAPLLSALKEAEKELRVNRGLDTEAALREKAATAKTAVEAKIAEIRKARPEWLSTRSSATQQAQTSVKEMNRAVARLKAQDRNLAAARRSFGRAICATDEDTLRRLSSGIREKAESLRKEFEKVETALDESRKEWPPLRPSLVRLGVASACVVVLILGIAFAISSATPAGGQARKEAEKKAQTEKKAKLQKTEKTETERESDEELTRDVKLVL